VSTIYTLNLCTEEEKRSRERGYNNYRSEVNKPVTQKLMQQLQRWGMGVHGPRRDAPRVLLLMVGPLALPANTVEWSPLFHSWDVEELEAVPLLLPWKRNRTGKKWQHFVKNLCHQLLIRFSNFLQQFKIVVWVCMLQAANYNNALLESSPKNTEECLRNSPHPIHSKVACPVPSQ
jgi:hypothetical protein